MANWQRDVVELRDGDYDILRSARWTGHAWAVPAYAPEVMARLSKIGLIEQRGGMWALTLKGHRHRHRRALGRSVL